MTLLEQVKQLVKSGKISPNKLRGQNFCIDEKVLEQMVAAGELNKNSCVLEIGPGLGFLTERIQALSGQVITVEVEQNFKKILEIKKAFWPKVDLRFGDVLQFSNQEIANWFKPQPYQIITNLPYGISGIFFRRFLAVTPQPTSITAMIQAEVGERLCAIPGNLSLLGLQAQVYSKPQIVARVEPSSFWPRPAVQSVIVKLTNIHPWLEAKISEKRFWQLAKIGFAAKRKTLANNLAAGLHLDRLTVEQWLKQANLSLLVRAQELSVADWVKLTRYSI
ncbi:MAG: 16S rRNA (adenine(1518)-N(6)/adenine(1519)-N(6))-dimethyltransferase RsmA [Candidatus Komeilibacteria bacterium]|nr:16S rRNA (adenine(1518)-N(6)/adenine(1519)-N(6))-dimethyltransferase RsmA [Candidatus Komeilibacteria bacterium]